MARIVFNSDTGGAGDTVLVSWLAEGLRAKGHECLFFSGNHKFRTLLRILQQPLAETQDGAIPLGSRFPPYHVELTVDRGASPRAAVWGSQLPDAPLPIRPRIKIPGNLRKWAALEQTKSAGGKPVVGIFPFANYRPRVWPAAHWVKLVADLEAAGYKVWAFCEGRQKNLLPPGVFRYWGFGWDSVAALVERCALVIGNDSAGAHLAGTLGRKTIAVMGPMSKIFGHMPEVRELHVSSDILPCVKCHFHKDGGYVQECNAGCKALTLLTPEAVFAVAKEMLNAA